jgi:hypothetical protein
VGITYAISVYVQNERKDENLSGPPTALELVGDACLTIAENAATKINVVVEFQKLEKHSRKLHVFEACMHDRGYTENPAWLKYTEPLARQMAKQKQLSFDEEITTLGREQMLELHPQNDKPIYWIVRK